MSGLIPLAGFTAFAARRLLTYLHIFQQEEYDGPRFLRWLVRSATYDRRLSIPIIILAVAQVVVGGAAPGWLFPGSIAVACLLAAAIESDPRKDAKKPLAMTARANAMRSLRYLRRRDSA